MIDEEKIIIDRVNVLKCKHYEYKSLKDCEMRYPESGDCEIGLLNYLFNGNLDIEKFCKDNPNCYFKQLARKTQELDKYKQSLDEKNKFLQDLGISASGEFKRIKFYIENLKNKYNEKVEECEELISEKDFYLQKIAVLEHECEELKEKIRIKDDENSNLNKKYRQEQAEKISYRKALEEIENNINKYFEESFYKNCRYAKGCTSACGLATNRVFNHILDIINKAKGKE